MSPPPPSPLREKPLAPLPQAIDGGHGAGSAPPPPPPRVAAAVDVGALAVTVAPHMTDACKTSVEKAAITGVLAAWAKGRAADSKWAFSRVENCQGNTQHAVDPALDMANRRGEEVEALRVELKESKGGKQKAEVEVAKLREVEALRRTRDDLQQRWGVAEAQVRSLTSIPNRCLV